LNLGRLVLDFVRSCAAYRTEVPVFSIKSLYHGVHWGKQYSENMYFILKHAYLLKYSVTSHSQLSH